jgi:hypothetical protein
MFNIIVLILGILFFIISISLIILYIDRNRLSRMTEKFTDYVSVLEYHLVKAYDIIYKDRILIYSLEATKVDDKEFNIISKDFVYLVLKFIGPNLKDQFVELYGNEETFIFNIVEYFNTRIEKDEIRERAKENLFTEDEKKLF